MTATKYTYSIATDFVVNHLVNEAHLIHEIATSTITVAYDHVDTDGDVCEIWMKAALSEGDKTLLDSLVAAHTGICLEHQTDTVKIEGPTTSDGKPIFLPCLFPGNVYLYPTGAGDNVTNQTRGDGQAFQVECTAAQDYDVEWQFIDWVYLAGGGVRWQNGEIGDWLSLLIYAPATTVVPNVGNTGNCNLVDPGVGQAILIVPAAGNGAYDVDLATAIPVPAFTETEAGVSTPNGFYEWSGPNTGLGVVTAGVAQHSNFNLCAIAINLVRFANRLQLVGDNIQDMTIPAVKPKKILPQWKFKTTAHHVAGTKNFNAQWWLVTARAQTI